MTVGPDVAGFRFALPPSLGHAPVKALARTLADVLYRAGIDTIIPMPSYQALERALIDGEVDAAWGPPMVCARVEAVGGAVAMRAMRHGGTTYRSVLICRAVDSLDLKSLGQDGRRPRAVWVDAASMGGRILARHHLKSRGIDPATAFEDERLLGSYAACVEEVLDFGADVTATYATRRTLGYQELCRDRADELRVLAYSDESPNDGLVFAPGLAADARAALGDALARLVADPTARQVLAVAFEAEGFDRPPAWTYRPLLALE